MVMLYTVAPRVVWAMRSIRVDWPSCPMTMSPSRSSTPGVQPPVDHVERVLRRRLDNVPTKLDLPRHRVSLERFCDSTRTQLCIRQQFGPRVYEVSHPQRLVGSRTLRRGGAGGGGDSQATTGKVITRTPTVGCTNGPANAVTE